MGAPSPERSAVSERAKIKARASGCRRAIPERSRDRSPGAHDPSGRSRTALKETGAGSPPCVQAPYSAGKHHSSGYARRMACVPFMLAAIRRIPWLPGPSYTPRRVLKVAPLPGVEFSSTGYSVCPTPFPARPFLAGSFPRSTLDSRTILSLAGRRTVSRSYGLPLFSYHRSRASSPSARSKVRTKSSSTRRAPS